jgi:hypothetical protein
VTIVISSSGKISLQTPLAATIRIKHLRSDHESHELHGLATLVANPYRFRDVVSLCPLRVKTKRGRYVDLTCTLIALLFYLLFLRH